MSEDLYKAWEYLEEGVHQLNRAESAYINGRPLLDYLVDTKENVQNALVYLDALIEQELDR